MSRITHLKTMLKRVGTRRFLTEIIWAGIRKRIASRIGYMRFSKTYPQHCIFIAGLPKSGSTWVSDLMSSIPGFAQFTPVAWNQEYTMGKTGQDEHALTPECFSAFAGKLSVVKGHTWGTPVNIQELEKAALRYFITVRDPRDVLISEYWFVRRSPHHVDHSLTTRLSLPDYVTEKLSSGAFNTKTLNWIRIWMANRNTEMSRVLRYEDILQDPHSVFSNAVDFLRLPLTPKQKEQIVEANQFEQKTNRKRGAEDTTQFYRKGTSGEWKDIFTQEQSDLFNSQGRDVLVALGYEEMNELES